MKKIIIAIVAVVAVAAIAVGGYFALFADKGSDSAPVVAVKDDFVENANLLPALMMNPDRYQASLETDYAMGEATAAEFYEAPENWLAYEQIIKVTNNSGDNITVYGFEVENNGKNGVYVNTNIGGQLGIAPGGSGPASFSVLLSDGELSIDEAKALVDGLKINVVYTKTPVEYDDGTESVEETKTAAIEAPEVE